MHEYITFYRQDISKCCARLFINRESVRSSGAQSQKGRLKYDLKLAGGGVNSLCTVRYSVDNVMNYFVLYAVCYHRKLVPRISVNWPATKGNANLT
jgi:hypothetical protein